MPDAASRHIVAAWLAAGRPFIVRRQASGFIAGRSPVAVGLPLPPTHGKLRIALDLAPDTVACIVSPPAIADVIAAAPPRWQSALIRLRTAATKQGVVFRVFGSVAWQALTGLPYLTGRSDIDLLWHVAQREGLDAGVAVLSAWEVATGLRADGEIVFGDDAAVSWREWQRCPRHQRVLVKELTSTTLRTREELLERLSKPTERRREYRVRA
jgi:phosphoribosyl-dephospho-CoA transferase